MILDDALPRAVSQAGMKITFLNRGWENGIHGGERSTSAESLN